MSAVTTPEQAATDERELFDAVKNLIAIYFRRVPTADTNPDELTHLIAEGLSDEFKRLCEIERLSEALVKEARRGGFVDLFDALAHASDGQVGKYGGEQ